MHRRTFDVILPSVSGEDKSTLNVVAGRTHEGVVLETADQHGLVLNYVHQVHLCAARKTTHATTPFHRSVAHWV
jgi:hypothetical protein